MHLGKVDFMSAAAAAAAAAELNAAPGQAIALQAPAQATGPTAVNGAPVNSMNCQKVSLLA